MVPSLKFVNVQDLLTVSCKTNDPDANVTLRYKTAPSKPTEDVLTRKYASGRVLKKGQDFIFSPIRMSDGGYYNCFAKNKDNTATLELGTLQVSPGNKNYLIWYLHLA